MPAVISMRNLSKVYDLGETQVHALRSVNLTIEAGEYVAIMGPSGSGKSTLMNIIGCLDKPTSGEYCLLDRRVDSMSRNELADIRSEVLGFIFQGFNLLSRTSTLENVELPAQYLRKKKLANPRGRALDALKKVGLAERLHHVPSQLSGGQQQRVAIARALVNQPAVLLADEPTGNLDSATSIEIMDIFKQLNDQGITVVMVTHEPDIAAYSKRILVVRDGCIIKDEAVRK
ncbi:MAG TPA: ABC transporter ATP-binding protein [Fibrobacteraceae bacterium]|nr:ABC transporter ATP-binding protein [Fibrobacteraceae bacterium]